LLCAFELALTEPRTVVLAGNPQSPDFQSLVAVLHEKLGLRRVILAIDDSSPGAEARQWLATHRPYLADMKAIDGQATAYVCENFTCEQPVCETGGLRHLIERG
jgi:uncharacterized protein YyaL (SSP411 family)